MVASSLRFSLRQLRYFVAVAEAGSMAAAAETQHVSQSAISLAVTQLERALGVQLFLRRKARGIALTDAGRRVLPEVRSLLAHASEVQFTAQSLGYEISGELVVGCYPTLTPFVLPTVLRRFAQERVGVRVLLFEGTVPEMTGRLLDGTCEVALMYDLGLSADIARTVLFQVRPYVILPAGHPQADDGPVTLADLSGIPMVLLDMEPSATMFREVLATGGLDPEIQLVSTNFESVRSLVASGAGFSILLQRPSPEYTYAGRALVYREIADSVRSVDVVLATASGGRLTRRAAAFADCCRTSLRLR